MNPAIASFARGPGLFGAVLAALLAACLGLGAVGWKAYQEIAAQAARYRDIKSLRENAGRADSLSAAYAALQADLGALRTALPERNQGSHVLNILVESARGNRLDIGGITGLDEVRFPGYRELPFEVEVSGSFKDLIGYVRALETGGMALQVRKLSAWAEAMNKPRIRAKLEASVFVPDQAGAAP